MALFSPRKSNARAAQKSYVTAWSWKVFLLTTWLRLPLPAKATIVSPVFLFAGWIVAGWAGVASVALVIGAVLRYLASPRVKLQTRVQQLTKGFPLVRISGVNKRGNATKITISGWPNVVDDSKDADIWEELRLATEAKYSGQWQYLKKEPSKNRGVLYRLPHLADRVLLDWIELDRPAIPIGVTDADTADAVVTTSDGTKLPVKLWEYEGSGSDSAPHMIIAGETGNGKSAYVRAMAILARAKGDIVVIDAKRAGDFAFIKDYCALINDVLGYEASSANKCAAMVRLVKEEIERRFDYQSQAKENNLPVNLRPMFVFLDEYIGLGEELSDRAAKDYWRDLGVILRKGRSARVFMVLATQRPDLDKGFKGETRDQAGYRIGVGPFGQDGSKMLFRDSRAGQLTLPVKGRALAGRLGGTLVRVQGFWVADPRADDATDSDKERVLTLLKRV